MYAAQGFVFLGAIHWKSNWQHGDATCSMAMQPAYLQCYDIHAADPNSDQHCLLCVVSTWCMHCCCCLTRLLQSLQALQSQAKSHTEALSQLTQQYQQACTRLAAAATEESELRQQLACSQQQNQLLQDKGQQLQQQNQQLQQRLQQVGWRARATLCYVGAMQADMV